MTALLITTATMVAITTIAVSGLGLIAGRGGMLSLAHAGCLGAGSYAAALAVKQDLGGVLMFTLAILTSATFAALVAAIAARLRDDAFVIVTFALQILFVSLLLEATSITRGALGITGVRVSPSRTWDLLDPVAFLVVCTLTALGSVLVFGVIAESDFGRSLAVVRDDEAFALSLGFRPKRIRTVALIVGGAVAGVAGVFYALYLGVVTPSQFGIMESVMMLAMVLLGGPESRWGPVLGAVVLVTFPEILRFVGVPAVIAGDVRSVLYGIGLVVVVFFRPRGMAG